MGTRLSLKITAKDNVMFMNTMMDGFPKEIIPLLNDLENNWNYFLSDLATRQNSGEFISPLINRWVSDMSVFLDDVKANPTVEKYAVLIANMKFHLMRFIPWNTNKKLNDSYPVCARGSDLSYSIESKKTKTVKGYKHEPLEPIALAPGRKLGVIKSHSGEKVREAMGINFSIPEDMTVDEFEKYFQEVMSLETQLAYLSANPHDDNQIARKRFNSRNYDHIYKKDKMIVEMMNLNPEEGFPFFLLLRTSGSGYYNLHTDMLLSSLSLVSAGKILPLNEGNALWAKEQPVTEFAVKQYIENISDFRFFVNEVKTNAINIRNEVFDDFSVFCKSVKPSFKPRYKIFDLDIKKSGMLKTYPVIDMIRFFELLGDMEYKMPEEMATQSHIKQLVYEPYKKAKPNNETKEGVKND